MDVDTEVCSVSPVVLRHQGKCVLMAWDERVSLEWFDPENPAIQATPVASGGRGSAWYVLVLGLPAVLRHFRRGGLIARLVRDLYIWTGVSRTRSFREFETLASLHADGLNVPRPVAAMACRTRGMGLFYRAAIVTERIDGARSLGEMGDAQVWFRAGEAISRMHRLGVWHADLNVHNLQVDRDGAVWIIDFDRARHRVGDSSQLRDNLRRLERSILKVCPGLHDKCWPMLLAGYGQANV